MISRRKERAQLSRALEKDNGGLEGLTAERKRALQLALKNPRSLPNTPEEIAADRERRENAMVEIRVSDIFYIHRIRYVPSFGFRDNRVRGVEMLV